MEERQNLNYFNSFVSYWIPILKKQVFKARLSNDIEWQISIRENIWKNIHFNKERRDQVLKEVGL